MATTFYITAGLPAQDGSEARSSNAFYITAGLPANDKPAATTTADLSGYYDSYTYMKMSPNI